MKKLMILLVSACFLMLLSASAFAASCSIRIDSLRTAEVTWSDCWYQGLWGAVPQLVWLRYIPPDLPAGLAINEPGCECKQVANEKYVGYTEKAKLQCVCLDGYKRLTEEEGGCYSLPTAGGVWRNVTLFINCTPESNYTVNLTEPEPALCSPDSCPPGEPCSDYSCGPGTVCVTDGDCAAGEVCGEEGLCLEGSAIPEFNSSKLFIAIVAIAAILCVAFIVLKKK